MSNLRYGGSGIGSTVYTPWKYIMEVDGMAPDHFPLYRPVVLHFHSRECSSHHSPTLTHFGAQRRSAVDPRVEATDCPGDPPIQYVEQCPPGPHRTGGESPRVRIDWSGGWSRFMSVWLAEVTACRACGMTVTIGTSFGCPCWSYSQFL